MAGVQLSNGAIQAILTGGSPAKPVLQVLNVKKIQSENASTDRYRLQMSDGLYHQPCMLATQMNAKINSKELDKYSIVEVNRYLCNTIHERKIIIIVELTVLSTGQEVGRAIGHPQPLDILRVNSNAQQPPRPPPGGNQGGGMGGGGGYGGGGYGGGGGAPNGMHPPNPSSTYGGGPNQMGASMSGPGGSMNQSPYRSAAPPSRPGFSPISQRNIFPINSLSPYQNKWTIRARSSKPSIRTWSNSRGEGRVFNVDLMDETGEIRACGFNETADKFYPMFEAGKAYYVSRGRLKPANKQFSSVKNDYELTLTDDSEVELCTDDSQATLPTMSYTFTSIAEIERVETGQLIDVIGVCKETADVATIISSKSNRKFSKRDIQLVDTSGKVVTCTLWAAEAEGFDGSSCPVVALKGVKVSDFGGRSLTTQFSTVMTLDPDIPESFQLRGWFDNVGKNEVGSSISVQGRGGGAQASAFLTLAQVKELDLGRKEKPDYFDCKAMVTVAKKDNCLYRACPTADCNKKVTESGGGGQYHCEKCNQTFPNFKYRLILSLNIADHSGSHWITCFQDSATEILGKSSQELGDLKDHDEAGFDDVFQQANFKEYIFRMRAKMETFNEEQRLKCLCMGVHPVNYAQETRRRIEEIKRLMA